MKHNKHLSHSRLNRYATCNLSYRLHYVDEFTAEPGTPLKFGNLLHAVLEVLVREHMQYERSGILSVDRAKELYQEHWAKSGLTGLDLFQEGLSIIKEFIRDQGELDHRKVLAVEKEFHLQVGRFEVMGFIDRVDWVDDETIEIIDYKSNRMLFTREEVDHSLQLSLYCLAARELWPWVKKVQLSFHMLRHGVRMRTERTEEQLQATRAYVESMGDKIENATEFPARLNANCSYCDHKQHCPAYADALKGKRKEICADSEDIEAVAKEREEVANLAKILYSRKSELDNIIKTHLKHHDELQVNGVRYKMLNTARIEYPYEQTLLALNDITGLSRDELVSQVAAIDKKAVDQLVKDVSKDRSHARLVKAELENVATKSYSPRLWAKAVMS